MNIDRTLCDDLLRLANRSKMVKSQICTKYVTMRKVTVKNKIKVEQSLCKPGQASGFQEVEDRRVQDIGHIKMVRLSVLRTGRLYPPLREIFLVLISAIGWVYPSPRVQPEGLCKWKFPKTPSEIEISPSSS